MLVQKTTSAKTRFKMQEDSKVYYVNHNLPSPLSEKLKTCLESLSMLGLKPSSNHSCTMNSNSLSNMTTRKKNQRQPPTTKPSSNSSKSQRKRVMTARQSSVIALKSALLILDNPCWVSARIRMDESDVDITLLDRTRVASPATPVQQVRDIISRPYQKR